MKHCMLEAKRGRPLIPTRSPAEPKSKHSNLELGQIPEEDADKEITQKLNSQRASQTEIAPDQVNLAINEPDDQP